MFINFCFFTILCWISTVLWEANRCELVSYLLWWACKIIQPHSHEAHLGSPDIDSIITEWTKLSDYAEGFFLLFYKSLAKYVPCVHWQNILNVSMESYVLSLLFPGVKRDKNNFIVSYINSHYLPELQSAHFWIGIKGVLWSNTDNESV